MKLTFMTSDRRAGGGATSFWFQPQEPLVWQAGQSIKLELPAGYGVEERRFTISSAPYEQQIRITTRVSDSKFKQSLAALRPGDDVRAFSVEGSFVWREADEQHVFCALGIGITPYVAMLRQREHDGRPLTAHLWYAAPPDRWVFRDELERLAREHDEFTVTFVAGKLSMDDISPEGFVYLCGPTEAVDQQSDELLSRGIAPERIIRDWFTGRVGWAVETA